MRSSSRYLLLLFFLIAALLAGYMVESLPQPPDTQQIADQIAALQSAAQHRDVSGIMREISDTYQDSNLTDVDQLQLLISRHVQDIGESEISYTAPNTTVTGDTATSTTTVTAIDPHTNAPLYERSITLSWKREPGYKYLVIPTKVWRITSADYGSVGDE